MSYADVKEMAADEKVLICHLMRVDNLTKTAEGIEELKTNIRLQRTAPELNKMRERWV